MEKVMGKFSIRAIANPFWLLRRLSLLLPTYVGFRNRHSHYIPKFQIWKSITGDRKTKIKL